MGVRILFGAVIALFTLNLAHALTTESVLPRPQLDGRIVGGATIDIQAVPFQVSLQRSFHLCGGSLIGKRIVLTAAHCTNGSQAAAIKVRIGSTFSSQGGVLVGIANIIRHPNYSPSSMDYDFALLQIDDYDDTEIISGIIKLPLAGQDWADGTMFTVSGWGSTQIATDSRSALRAVTVPKFNQETCNAAYARYGGITRQMICAGYTQGGKDACQGDSGGPLFHNNTLVGVVSWGVGCAESSFPGVYARVTAVRNWITEMTGI